MGSWSHLSEGLGEVLPNKARDSQRGKRTIKNAYRFRFPPNSSLFWRSKEGEKKKRTQIQMKSDGVKLCFFTYFGINEMNRHS